MGEFVRDVHEVRVADILVLSCARVPCAMSCQESTNPLRYVMRQTTNRLPPWGLESRTPLAVEKKVTSEVVVVGKIVTLNKWHTVTVHVPCFNTLMCLATYSINMIHLYTHKLKHTIT